MQGIIVGLVLLINTKHNTIFQMTVIDKKSIYFTQSWLTLNFMETNS